METRYLTKGISETIPFEIQIFLWNAVDESVESKIDTDYLQVFKFKVEDEKLKITHHQEVPEILKEYQFKLREGYKQLDKVKIFIIDDITHSTMLLAEEY
ncbi:MAG: DUF960 domain-containing protein [Acholeplasmataceae bacterium]|nr:DUF960 domain-containing protein [Acholeplasmataceae bacterium]